MGGTRCKHVSQESFERPVKKDNTVTDFLVGEGDYNTQECSPQKESLWQARVTAVQCSAHFGEQLTLKQLCFQRASSNMGEDSWKLQSRLRCVHHAGSSTAPAPKHTLLSGFDLSGSPAPATGTPFILLIAAQVFVFLPPPLEGELLSFRGTGHTTLGHFLPCASPSFPLALGDIFCSVCGQSPVMAGVIPNPTQKVEWASQIVHGNSPQPRLATGGKSRCQHISSLYTSNPDSTTAVSPINNEL